MNVDNRIWSRRRLWIILRAILAGWAALLAIGYLLEGPLLIWAAPILGAGWFATARLAVDCCALAATGWVVGYLGRPDSRSAVLLFAATLTFRDFEPVFLLNVPWLFRLAINSVRDSRYLESLFATAVAQGLLLGCILAGGRLAHPAQARLKLWNE